LAYGPYLDYRPLASDELELETLLTRPELGWMGVNLEQVHAELMAALDGIAAGIGHCDCVYNDVTPQRKIREHGFRAWTQLKTDRLVECHCDWAGVDLHGLRHYRMRD
jgi:hypothetical protein